MTTKALQEEVIYSYAMMQRYKNLSAKYKDNLYSDTLSVTLTQEDLDKYSKTFVALYEAKYHDDMVLLKQDKLFKELYYSDETASKLFSIMFRYVKKTKTLSTTKAFNQKYVEDILNKILTKEELDILNKSECKNIAIKETIHPSNMETIKVNLYKKHYSDFSEKDVRLQQNEFEKTYTMHKNFIINRITRLLKNTSKANSSGLAFNTDKMTKDMEILAENLPAMSRTVQSIIACKQAMPNNKKDFKDYIISRCLEDSEIRHKENLKQDIIKTLKSHKMNINKKDVDLIAEELIVMAPALSKIIPSSIAMRECSLRLKAIESVLPPTPQKKQIGENTPPKKVVEKYITMTNQARLRSDILGSDKVKPINDLDTIKYNKARQSLLNKELCDTKPNNGR